MLQRRRGQVAVAALAAACCVAAVALGGGTRALAGPIELLPAHGAGGGIASEVGEYSSAWRQARDACHYGLECARRCRRRLRDGEHGEQQQRGGPERARRCHRRDGEQQQQQRGAEGPCTARGEACTVGAERGGARAAAPLWRW